MPGIPMDYSLVTALVLPLNWSVRATEGLSLDWLIKISFMCLDRRYRKYY